MEALERALALEGAGGGHLDQRRPSSLHHRVLAGADLSDARLADRAAAPLIEQHDADRAGPVRGVGGARPGEASRAVKGFLLGGTRLAVSCDFRGKAEDAHFRPEIPLGLPARPSPRLVSLVLPAKTKQLVIFWRARVAAADALAWGLIDL